MTDPTYAPFPSTAELENIAKYHDVVAPLWPDGSVLRGVHERHAQVCRDAIAGHDALRERFLEQTMLVRELEAKLKAFTMSEAAD